MISRVTDLFMAHPAIAAGLTIGGLLVALVWAVMASSYRYR